MYLKIEKLVALLGRRPEELDGDYTPKVKEAMTSGRLNRIEGGVVELAKNALPASVCRAAGAMLGIEDVFVIGYARGLVSGGVILVTRRPGLALPAALLEAMVMLSAAAIVRVRSEKDRYRSRLITENLPVGLYLYHLDDLSNDRTLRLVYANPAVRDLTGVGPENLIGRILDENFPNLRAQGVPQRYAEVVRSQTPDSFEDLTYQDDRVLQASFSVKAFPLPGDHLGVFFENTSERRRVEEALRQSERRHRMVIDSMGEGLGIVDPEERFIFVNPAGAEIFGLSQGDLMGRCLQEFMSPFQWSGVRAQTSLREKGERSSYDLRITRADGEERVLRVTGTPQHDADGRFAGTFGVFSDVTEQIRAEEYVKELAGLLDVSPLSVTVHDERGVWLYANDRTMSMHGYSKEEFMSLNLSQVDAPESAQLIDERMRLIAEKGEALFEVRHLRKDGSSFPLEVSVMKTSWFGRPALLSMAWDITERKRMEEEKDKLQEQLNQAQKMESVGRLAGGVAHDFNNMLGAILGHVELALESVGSDQTLLENLLEIRKATERSAELTRQLLAFARKQTVAPRTLDLNDSVSSMLKMLRRLIGEDIDLIWLPGRDTSFVKIDPTQVDQILANLCINARDAIAGTGKITIETGRVSIDDQLCGQCTELMAGDYVVLAVSDDGCGMDAKTLDHLFEPFFTTKATGKGTGLGLATVYGIVKQNHGHIQVHSSPGLGTTLKVYLPLRSDRPVSALPATTATSSEEGGSETILLVEDEAALERASTRLLQRLGYTVLAANTPAEAVRLAQEHPGKIDLLLTDVVMPEMNGRDLAKIILSIHPDIKRLFMSGYTADAIAPHGVLHEDVHFLQKPFSMTVLGEQVRLALDA